ncbi:SMI1/KNR4 family protein [Deinococcota bacterium DY0809b]
MKQKEFVPLPEERWPEPHPAFAINWPRLFFHHLYTRYRHRGYFHTPYGGTRIGSYLTATGLDDFPPGEFWMHTFFPPLLSEELDAMQEHFGFELPQEFKEWYSFSNGGWFYAGHLNPYGWMNERFGVFAVGTGLWSIREPNYRMRRRGAPEHLWFFGSYDLRYGRNWLYLDRETGLIHQTVDEDDWTPRATWPSLRACFEEAAATLDTYWNERGVRIKPWEGEMEYRALMEERARLRQEERERQRLERNRRRREAYRRKKAEEAARSGGKGASARRTKKASAKTKDSKTKQDSATAAGAKGEARKKAKKKAGRKGGTKGETPE